MPADLEFQMFVLDEHADELIDQGKDVLKLTIGVPELSTPQVVLDRIVDVLNDPDFVRRVYPEGLPELREAIAAEEQDHIDEELGALLFTLANRPESVAINTSSLTSSWRSSLPRTSARASRVARYNCSCSPPERFSKVTDCPTVSGITAAGSNASPI